MFLVDTNILVYAVNAQSPRHRAARRFIDECQSGAEVWLTTWSVVYEFLRVITHPATLEQPIGLPRAWGIVQALLSSPSFQIIEETARHAEVMSDLVQRHPAIHGNDVHDLHIVAVMLENGVREIRTADSGFHRFRFLNVVNPLAP